MTMFGQQLGRPEIDSSMEPPFVSATDVGRQPLVTSVQGNTEPPFTSATDVGYRCPLADRNGFSYGRGWITSVAASIDSGPFARQGNIRRPLVDPPRGIRAAMHSG